MYCMINFDFIDGVSTNCTIVGPPPPPLIVSLEPEEEECRVPID